MTGVPETGDLLRERGGVELSQTLEGAGRRGATCAPPGHKTSHLVIECASIGAVLGATLGVLAATVLATASMTLLGVGIAGPLAAAFIGAIGGAGGGALVGGAFDAGFVSRRAPSSRECVESDCVRDPARAAPNVPERAP